MRLGSRDGRVTGDWSKSGGAGEPQPDNREYKVEGEHDESCIAMLNNFYGDGAVSWAFRFFHSCIFFFQVWHDIACYHKKWFVCEDSDKLMDFARQTSPEHAPRI